MFNFRQFVDEFNSDELSDFRQCLKNDFKTRGYKNGYELIHAFIKVHALYEEWSIFNTEDSYRIFVDSYFNALYGV